MVNAGCSDNGGCGGDGVWVVIDVVVMMIVVVVLVVVVVMLVGWLWCLCSDGSCGGDGGCAGGELMVDRFLNILEDPF